MTQVTLTFVNVSYVKMLGKMSLISINIPTGVESWLAGQVVDGSIATKRKCKMDLIIIISSIR